MATKKNTRVINSNLESVSAENVDLQALYATIAKMQATVDTLNAELNASKKREAELSEKYNTGDENKAYFSYESEYKLLVVIPSINKWSSVIKSAITLAQRTQVGNEQRTTSTISTGLRKGESVYCAYRLYASEFEKAQELLNFHFCKEPFEGMSKTGESNYFVPCTMERLKALGDYEFKKALDARKQKDSGLSEAQAIEIEKNAFSFCKD